MLNIFKFLVNSHSGSNHAVESAYKHQLLYLRKVWDGDSYGLDRLVRLFLCLMQFIYPLLLIREIFGRFGSISRKLAVEFYNLLKLFLPFFVLIFGLYNYPLVMVFIVYLLSETVLHILSLIFLSDIHLTTVSYRRSMLLLFLHYLEVVADFAVFYVGFNLLSQPLSWVSAFYFSVVANTTVGFGDIFAKGRAGQLLVSVQLLIGIIFIILFIDYFSNKKE